MSHLKQLIQRKKNVTIIKSAILRKICVILMFNVGYLIKKIKKSLIIL